MSAVEGGERGGGGLFVRVFLFRDEIVDQAHHEDAQEEKSHIEPDSLHRAVGLSQRGGSLLKNFHKGDVEHDSGREAGGDGKEPVVGLLGHESDDAADAGGQTGKEGQSEGDPEGAKFHALLS